MKVRRVIVLALVLLVAIIRTMGISYADLAFAPNVDGYPEIRISGECKVQNLTYICGSAGKSINVGDGTYNGYLGCFGENSEVLWQKMFISPSNVNGQEFQTIFVSDNVITIFGYTWWESSTFVMQLDLQGNLLSEQVIMDKELKSVSYNPATESYATIYTIYGVGQKGNVTSSFMDKIIFLTNDFKQIGEVIIKDKDHITYTVNDLLFLDNKLYLICEGTYCGYYEEPWLKFTLQAKHSRLSQNPGALICVDIDTQEMSVLEMVHAPFGVKGKSVELHDDGIKVIFERHVDITVPPPGASVEYVTVNEDYEMVIPYE